MRILLFCVFCLSQQKLVYTCVSEATSSLHSSISHLLQKNFSVHAGKLHGFFRGRRAALWNVNRPGNSSHMIFPVPLKGTPWHQHQKTYIEAEAIGIIWLCWVSCTKLCYENKMLLPSITPRGGNVFVIECDFEADSLCKICFFACCPKKIHFAFAPLFGSTKICLETEFSKLH